MFTYLLKIVISTVVLFFCLTFLCAQSAITAAGGEATGPGGTLSYSCGIVAFTHYTGNSFLLNQGVQHGFEIPQLYVNTRKVDYQNFEVFPNPTKNDFTIKKDIRVQGHPQVHVFSQEGKVLHCDMLFDENTNLSLNGFSNGTYIVAISDDGVVLKYFKIIKQE